MNEQDRRNKDLCDAVFNSIESDPIALGWLATSHEVLLRAQLPASRILTTVWATSRIISQHKDNKYQFLETGVHGLMSCLHYPELRILGENRVPQSTERSDKWSRTFLSIGDMGERFLLDRNGRDGFTLLQEGIKIIQATSNGSILDREIVEGAHLGARVYKRLFPLAVTLID